MHRHIVNSPESAAEEALEGLALTHPQLVAYNREAGIVTRPEPARDKVGLVSGGGCGHEPLHAGFVGHGMLDAAVPGALFASPTALQVLNGTVAADSGRGVVQIVKNYTGDVLNFRIAGELAGDDAVKTEVVLVDDDLATDGQEDGPGRRGTAAVLAVEKICGAAAEAGAELGEVAALGRRVARRARTLSLAVRAGTHPGADGPAFVLPEGEVELGVGIHGERGTGRIAFADADQLIAELVDPLAAALELGRGSSVIAIVNGLGGACPLELSVCARTVHRRLAGQGVTIARSLAGSYVTSLDMHGVSVTLLPVDADLLPLWDASVRTPALTW
ncbi:dihydroxyacetone kinase subunit DhaK [Streptomyces sp. 5-6(2022)]|uniref:dihydroxyacetone kinase subunit DhaK n=1 Tax=Streptomyces sp. 5-6(2022) TaxID=2936510 RepID=UPI0023B8BA6D|nr:dihydroxyacetone kinase subunit DhaK [Streptomyces sp. 5-6(2022)]